MYNNYRYGYGDTEFYLTVLTSTGNTVKMGKGPSILLYRLVTVLKLK